MWVQVRIVLEGVDKFNNLTGSVYYPDGESAKDLALELVENVSNLLMLIWTLHNMETHSLCLILCLLACEPIVYQLHSSFVPFLMRLGGSSEFLRASSLPIIYCVFIKI